MTFTLSKTAQDVVDITDRNPIFSQSGLGGRDAKTPTNYFAAEAQVKWDWWQKVGASWKVKDKNTGKEEVKKDRATCNRWASAYLKSIGNDTFEFKQATFYSPALKLLADSLGGPLNGRLYAEINRYWSCIHLTDVSYRLEVLKGSTEERNELIKEYAKECLRNKDLLNSLRLYENFRYIFENQDIPIPVPRGFLPQISNLLLEIAKSSTDEYGELQSELNQIESILGDIEVATLESPIHARIAFLENDKFENGTIREKNNQYAWARARRGLESVTNQQYNQVAVPTAMQAAHFWAFRPSLSPDNPFYGANPNNPEDDSPAANHLRNKKYQEMHEDVSFGESMYSGVYHKPIKHWVAPHVKHDVTNAILNLLTRRDIDFHTWLSSNVSDLAEDVGYIYHYLASTEKQTWGDDPSKMWMVAYIIETLLKMRGMPANLLDYMKQEEEEEPDRQLLRTPEDIDVPNEDEIPSTDETLVLDSLRRRLSI